MRTMVGSTEYSRVRESEPYTYQPFELPGSPAHDAHELSEVDLFRVQLRSALSAVKLGRIMLHDTPDSSFRRIHADAEAFLESTLKEAR